MNVSPLYKATEKGAFEVSPFDEKGAHRQPYFQPEELQRFAEDHFTYRTPVLVLPGQEGFPEEPVPLAIQEQIHFYTAVTLAWMHHFYGQDYTFMLNPKLITQPTIIKFLESRADILGTRIQDGWQRFHERNKALKAQGQTRHAIDALAGFRGIVVGDVGYHLGNSPREENSPLH